MKDIDLPLAPVTKEERQLGSQTPGQQLVNAEEFGSSLIVQEALNQITDTLINQFLSGISQEEIPLRERLATFLNKRVGTRAESAERLVPELASVLDPNLRSVFPNFEFTVGNDLKVELGPEAVSMERDNLSVTIWIKLGDAGSVAEGFSAGLKLNPNEEVDGAVMESFKVGAVEMHMFGISPQDRNPDLSLVSYIRTRRAPWSREGSKGVYRVLADYRLHNVELEADLVNVAYGLLDVYGYEWQGDYMFEAGVLCKEPFKTYRKNIPRDSQLSGWETCPQTINVQEDGSFFIEPEGAVHPLLVVRNEVCIAPYIDKMLTFRRFLLSN